VSRSITVRKMHFDFDPNTVPRWWFMNNPVATHIANGLHLVFPEGERFFIRSVKHYLDRIEEDPELYARARAFFGQEAKHGQEHARSFEMIEAQGYDVSRFLEMYEKKAVPALEQIFPPNIKLAMTVALEHLTASLGESALRDRFLDDAHPVMRALLRWHAAEEIEHKSVAFDVLKRVDPRYSVRIAGMALGFIGLMTFWTIGTRMLLAQETGVSKKELKHYRKAVEDKRRAHTGQVLREAVLKYLRPSFHPDQNDNYHLAESYLRSVA
jgi:predicted metal-dependent hydrolase